MTDVTENTENTNDDTAAEQSESINGTEHSAAEQRLISAVFGSGVPAPESDEVAAPGEIADWLRESIGGAARAHAEVLDKLSVTIGGVAQVLAGPDAPEPHDIAAHVGRKMIVELADTTSNGHAFAMAAGEAIGALVVLCAQLSAVESA